ncbi:MAG: hypothetical protein KDB37_06305 [Ilumatobacter sp.]|nr:hypothetical protein [Ilumatobacter sp.]
MNPFDAPPSAPAVSFEPPEGPKRRRGRLIGAAVVGAGLVGAGAIGVSTLVSADDEPELATSPTTTVAATTPVTAPAPDTDETGPAECIVELPNIDEWIGEFDGEFDGELPAFDELFGDLQGEFERMLGDIELGELDLGEVDLGELDLGELDLGVLGGGSVTVLGPDGPTLVDLGDGDASVTIERDGDTGELTVTTDGTASTVDLDGLDDLGALLGDWAGCADGLHDQG